MDHVGVVVSDLEAAVAFFSALELEQAGSGPVSGAWVDRIVGLEGVRAELVFLQTPDGHGRLERLRPLERRSDPRIRWAARRSPGVWRARLGLTCN